MLHTGPRPYTISYMKGPNGKYTRYTLAFMCHLQWVTRNHYSPPGVKGTGPRNYHVWPVFCEAGKY